MDTALFPRVNKGLLHAIAPYLSPIEYSVQVPSSLLVYELSILVLDALVELEIHIRTPIPMVVA